MKRISFCEQGNYAAAYDKLIRALQSDPQNTGFDVCDGASVSDRQNEQRSGCGLRLPDDADMPTQDARVGAIDVALAEDNVGQSETARQRPAKRYVAAASDFTGTAGRGAGQSSAGDDLSAQRAASCWAAIDQQLQTPTMGGLLLADNPFVTTVMPVMCYGGDNVSVYVAAA